MTIELAPSRNRVPGRPRLQATDDSILSAAFTELCRSGYQGLTVDSVARRAGVGKPTVYRRYLGKRELAAAALASRLSAPASVDTGSLKGDVAAMLKSDVLWLRGPGGAQLVGVLLAERERDPWLVDLLRRDVVRPRQLQYSAAIERAIGRGEVKAETNASLVAMALWGALLAAVLAGTTPNQRGVEALAETMIRGIGI
jgi:AcrR family transcriptional regulator